MIYADFVEKVYDFTIDETGDVLPILPAVTNSGNVDSGVGGVFLVTVMSLLISTMMTKR